MSEEKLHIAVELDRIGAPLLDVGMPSVSAEEREAISAIAREGLKASIGVSARLNRDEIDQALDCSVGEVFIICPVSPIHMRYKLATDEEGIRGLAKDVVLYASQKGLVVNLVAEDASRAEIPFLCSLLRQAHHWGARRAFICDTVGVMEPFGMRTLVKRIREEIPQEMELGVHCHNDLGLATANTLAAIRKAVSCKLELIANHCCLFYCPFDLHHRNMVSHGSQDGHPCGGFAADYCKLNCQLRKLKRPIELIRARWIRPEDVRSYEEVGIDCLKLVERFRGTESLIRILDAYERRSYRGNLAELLTLPQEGSYLTPNLEIAQRPDLIEPERMEEVLAVLREPFSGRLSIDNEKLDGFLDHFRTVDCLRADCDRCGYCDRVAARAISIDEGWRQEMITRFERAIGILITGGLAGYQP